MPNLLNERKRFTIQCVLHADNHRLALQAANFPQIHGFSAVHLHQIACIHIHSNGDLEDPQYLSV